LSAARGKGWGCKRRPNSTRLCARTGLEAAREGSPTVGGGRRRRQAAAAVHRRVWAKVSGSGSFVEEVAGGSIGGEEGRRRELSGELELGGGNG